MLSWIRKKEGTMQRIIFFTGLSEIWQGIWREDESKHQLSLLCTRKTQRHDTARQVGCHHSSLLCLLWIRSVTVKRWLQTVRTHRQGLVAGLGVNAKFPLSAVRNWAHLWQTFDEGREKYIRTFRYKMQREEKKIQWASLSLFKTAVILHRHQTTLALNPFVGSTSFWLNQTKMFQF